MLKKTSDKVQYYGSQVLQLSGEVSGMSDAIERRISEKSSAELLLNNTNRILSTVYFGTADVGEKKEAKDFTAFSMLYNEKFYIITAGHCVEMDGEKYSNFKFKSNKTGNWIAPALMNYKSNYENNEDYAIFYSDRQVTMGLIPAGPAEDMAPQYVLGNLERGLNLVKRYNDAKEGESGSPILNSNCHVIGIMIKKGGTFTPIEIVLDALADLQN
jgi:V8-like Glu-specific endopeptidase